MEFAFGINVNLKQGTKVKVAIGTKIVRGIIVGKANTGPTQEHIVKCTDGTFPDKTYEYDTFVIPLSLIETYI